MSEHNSPGDRYELSGDFRGAQINIKSRVAGSPAAPVVPTPFNLPAPEGTFTGRGREIDQVRQALITRLTGVHCCCTLILWSEKGNHGSRQMADSAPGVPAGDSSGGLKEWQNEVILPGMVSCETP